MHPHVPRLSAPSGTRLILVRHGETLWNRAHRWQGHTDIALSELGREQAATLPPRLAGEAIAVCYASDLVRAAETAELLCAPLGLSPVRDAALREVCLGPFQGLTTAEIEARMPGALARRVESEDPADLDFALEGMESRRQFVDRAAAAVQHCAERSPGQTVLIVAHGGVLRAFFVAVFGLPYTSVRQVEIPNCAYNSFLAERGRWRLETWADVSHLGPRVTRAS